MTRRAALAALALAAFAGGLAAHVRLHNPSNQQKLYWQNEASIGIVINAAGSDDIADLSHFTALRNAIDAWNDVAGQTAQLVENTSPTQQARTDWENAIHLILFDEDDSTGYFPPGSGTVALTPVSFYSDGRIADADVLFNGSGFDFTTSDDSGHFDVQAVAAHELGHLLGLDHTGWAGGTMYPYVSPNLAAQRSLSLDETSGMRDVYPAQTFASISGVVRRSSDNSTVAGAHVVARDADGRTTAAALSNGTGSFLLEGLEAGDYTVCANPLDFPVSSANLTSGHTIETDFEATVGGSVVVTAGQSGAYGNLVVGDDVSLSLGRSSDTLPLLCEIGSTTSHSLRGTGLGAACTLQASDPALTVTPTSWIGSTIVQFDVQVPSGAAAGHVDLEVVDGSGARSILPAALELVPDEPSIFLAVPPQASDAGGTTVTILGSDFNAGSRVILGGEIYVDGEAGGCTVVDSGTITLTALATAVGTYDVVVMDPTGVEGRLDDGIEFVSVPQIDTVFPLAGADTGGTEVVITGSNFADPMVVTIDGALQSSVVVESSTLMRVTTSAYVAGGPYVLEVENPSSQVASAAFTYAAQADPSVSSVSPATGATTGGRVVTLTGTNFTSDATVEFGADPDTGLGGTPAAAVTFIDAQTLEVTTPSHAQGSVTVLVADASTGQAHVLAAAFTFTVPSVGGGGGCHTVPVSGPRDGASALAGAWWMLAVLLALGASHQAQRRRALAFARRATR